jgi:hypothetical protein
LSADRYTKTILTIIAASLVVLVVQNAIHPAAALLGDNVQKVAICDPMGVDCASVTFAGYSDSGIRGIPPMKLVGLQVVAKSP